MPKFNRRRFLQVASAASIVPALPALPSLGAAPVASATAVNLTHAQQLWASLCTHGGSTPNLTGLARAMGISNQAASGVYAKLVKSHIIAANGARHLSQVAPRSAVPTPKQPIVGSKPIPKIAPDLSTQKLELDVKKIVLEDPVLDNEDQMVDQNQVPSAKSLDQE